MKRIDEEDHQVSYRGNRNLFLGVVLIVIGVFVFFKSIGLFPSEVERIIFSWQMLLMVIGAVMLSRHSGRLGGLILIFIGAFFMLEEFADMSGQMRSFFWAGFFIFIGLAILLRAIRSPFQQFHRSSFASDSLDYVDEINIFGGSEKRILSSAFKGGRMTNIFGGSTFDFTDARLAPGHNILDVVSVFGGFKLIIPPDWNVKLEVTAILGGVSDKRTRVKEIQGNDKVLVIRGIAIFGGGEIKNF